MLLLLLNRFLLLWRSHSVLRHTETVTIKKTDLGRGQSTIITNNEDFTEHYGKHQLTQFTTIHKHAQL